MAVPTPGTSQNYRLRHIREVTQGTTPATAMNIIPIKTADPSGGDITRVQAGNVVTNRQVTYNIPTDRVPPSISGSSDLLNTVYNPFWAELMGGEMAVSTPTVATNISAVSPNVLHLASGSWTLIAGDRILVAGFSTNPILFTAEVLSAVGADLTLVAASLATPLVNEAAGASISVGYVGRFRVGTSTLFGTYEVFNLISNTGEVFRGHGCTGLTVKATHPGIPECSWTFSGAFIQGITAALANTSNAIPTEVPFNIGTGFGAQLMVNGGGGLMYGGALYPNVRVQDMTITFTCPRKQTGGFGAFGPQATYVDDLFKAKINVKVANDHADARQLLSDSRDESVVASLGFAWRAGNGKVEYWRFAALDPVKGKRGGIVQTGEDMIELEWDGHIDPVHTVFERTLLN